MRPKPNLWRNELRPFGGAGHDPPGGGPASGSTRGYCHPAPFPRQLRRVLPQGSGGPWHSGVCGSRGQRFWTPARRRCSGHFSRFWTIRSRTFLWRRFWPARCSDLRRITWGSIGRPARRALFEALTRAGGDRRYTGGSIPGPGPIPPPGCPAGESDPAPGGDLRQDPYGGGVCCHGRRGKAPPKSGISL